jgi:hypothetical protein
MPPPPVCDHITTKKSEHRRQELRGIAQIDRVELIPVCTFGLTDDILAKLPTNNSFRTDYTSHPPSRQRVASGPFDYILQCRRLRNFCCDFGGGRYATNYK